MKSSKCGTTCFSVVGLFLCTLFAPERCRADATPCSSKSTPLQNAPKKLGYVSIPYSYSSCLFDSRGVCKVDICIEWQGRESHRSQRELLWFSLFSVEQHSCGCEVRAWSLTNACTNRTSTCSKFCSQILRNKPPAIFELTLDGVVLRKFDLKHFDDTEGIVHMQVLDGYDFKRCNLKGGKIFWALLPHVCLAMYYKYIRHTLTRMHACTHTTHTHTHA